MNTLLLDSDTVNVLTDFCDVDTLTNRIELVEEVKDHLLEELGDTEDEKTKKWITDTMLSLHEMNTELKRIRKVQR